MNVKIIIVIIVAALLIGGFWFYQESSQQQDIGEEQKNVEMFEETLEYDVEVQAIDYYNGVQGYYARPANDGLYPGVVMIHEWWGLNDNIKTMARNLAGNGYAVLAVDLYHGEVAETSDKARELRAAISETEAVENLQSAVTFLKTEDAPRIASLGWCFGGGQSLNLALSGEILDATVIYYGSLITEKEKLDDIHWPVLGIFGAEDQSIPVETVNNFISALDELEIQNEIYIYPGVGHAFANPSGASYAPEETMDAWMKTLAFLKTHLQ